MLNKRGITPRCLFGTPDPLQTLILSKRIHSAKQWSFERRWNFDTFHEKPVSMSGSLPASQTVNEENMVYSWDECFEADYMAQCNQHRLKVPLAPKPRQITLLYAPTFVANTYDNHKAVSTTTSPAEVAATNSMDVSTIPSPLPSPPTIDPEQDNQEQVTISPEISIVKSPELFNQVKKSIYKSDAILNQSEARLKYVPVQYKQRSITDYMRVKRSSSRAKKI